MNPEIGKKGAGYRAAELITSGMKLGIGTGSTVFYFIEKLIERVDQGLQIEAAFSSERSKELAIAGGISPLPEGEFTELDITVDGADEIDPSRNMIKGGGGALLREKILASSSREMVVIVDENKCVDQLGQFNLPVEICPFATHSTIHRINELGLSGELRVQGDTLYQTDGGNYIYDLHLEEAISNPAPLHERLITLAGVIETGLFYGLAGRVIIGKSDGSIEIWENSPSQQ